MTSAATSCSVLSIRVDQIPERLLQEMTTPGARGMGLQVSTGLTVIFTLLGYATTLVRCFA